MKKGGLFVGSERCVAPVVTLCQLILLGLVLCFAGCSSAPDRMPPAAATTVSASVPVPSARQDTVHPQEVPFETLTVDRAVEEALRASPELEQIKQRIDASREQVKQAEASFYPRLVLSQEFSATDNPVFALMYLINQRRFTPDVDFNHPGREQNVASVVQGEWVLFEGGSRLFERKAAVSRHRAMDAELQAARNLLIARVTEVYYQWLQALVFTGVAEQALDAASTDESLGEARMKVEMALPSELLRLKARTAEARGNLVAAKTNARRLQAALERLIARQVRHSEIPQPVLEEWPSLQQDASRDSGLLVKQALDRRPEMAAVRALIEASRNRVRSAQGGLLPRVGTTARYQWDSEDLGDAAESWLVGLQATWPLFEGGMTVSRIREAKAHLLEMEARGEQVALDIALEVHQAVLAVQEAAEKVKVAGERRKWARQALEETRHVYRNQAATVDSLLNAELSWNQAEVAFAGALFEGKTAQAVLRKSLGDFTEWMEARRE